MRTTARGLRGPTLPTPLWWGEAGFADTNYTGVNALKLREALLKDLERGLSLLEDQYNIVHPLEADCIIFTGSGDSYAASLLAPAVSEKALAADPMDIAYSAYADLAKRCTLVAISVGGRTRAVIEAARVFRKKGGHVVALTGDPESPLAREADETVTLLHAGLAEGIGAGRQLLVLASILRLLGASKPVAPYFESECPDRIYGFVFTGCCETISTALFSALKVFEVYGLPSHWWSLEQLVHAPVYGLPGRVLVFESLTGAERVSEVIGVLRDVGVEVYTVKARGGNVSENAVASHVWFLRCLAESKDLPDEPKYRSHPGIDKLTRLIYAVEESY